MSVPGGVKKDETAAGKRFGKKNATAEIDETGPSWLPSAENPAIHSAPNQQASSLSQAVQLATKNRRMLRDGNIRSFQGGGEMYAIEAFERGIAACIAHDGVQF